MKAVLLGLGRLNIRHLLMLRTINFYRRAFMSDNNVQHTVFMSFLMSGCNEMLKSVLCIRLQLLVWFMDVLHLMYAVVLDFIVQVFLHLVSVVNILSVFCLPYFGE